MLLSEFWDTYTQKHTVMDASCGSLQTLFSRILSPRHLAVNWTGSVHTSVSLKETGHSSLKETPGSVTTGLVQLFIQ